MYIPTVNESEFQVYLLVLGERRDKVHIDTDA